MSEKDLPDWNELSKGYPLESAGAHWVMMVTCAHPQTRTPFLLDFNDEGFMVHGFETGTQAPGKLLAIYKKPTGSLAFPEITYKNEPVFNKTDLIRLVALFKLSLKVDL